MKDKNFSKSIMKQSRNTTFGCYKTDILHESPNRFRLGYDTITGSNSFGTLVNNITNTNLSNKE